MSKQAISKQKKKPAAKPVKTPKAAKPAKTGKAKNVKGDKKQSRSSSIKTKILIPILALTFVIIASGLLNVASMNSMQESSSLLTDKSLPTQIALDTAIADFSDLQRLIYAHCLSEDTTYMETCQTRADELFAEIETALATYEAGVSSEEDLALIADFRKNFDMYTYTFDTAEQLSYNMMKKLAQSYVPNLMQNSADTMQSQLQTMKANIQETIDSEVQAQRDSYNQAVIATVIATLIGIVIAILAFALVNRSVIRPIKKSTKSLDKIVSDIQAGHGDLTARIDLKSTDELGRLAKGINVFLETLQNIMSQIISNADHLGSVVNTVSGSVNTASGNASDISSLLEELSATMEEISSTTTSVNDEVANVGTQVSSIAQDTVTLNSYAGEMEARAKELEVAAQRNKESTSEIIGGIIHSLEEAIEESKSVSKVNDLTDEILNVSSQTNLLALNASIEAARAGEAGKGFAVVADEIRTLADSTRQTAGNIQEINLLVVRAVDALVENSNAIVNYVNETILPDYEKFVETGKQYRNDASHINHTMNIFQDRTNHLMQIMQEISEAVSGITTAIEESALGVTNATENTSTLVSNIEIVNQEMNTNQKISLQLKQEADRFTNL
ncbi:MAG: methyl-accepting chemotaxis protein [Lachnospiraceae bacterium]|nr:methyl-accepting chemotaxis protein [bacterium]MDY5516966.1 methyl-accepting chemotaxis protein [Lachnospiraceae bacterium]